MKSIFSAPVGMEGEPLSQLYLDCQALAGRIAGLHLEIAELSRYCSVDVTAIDHFAGERSCLEAWIRNAQDVEAALREQRLVLRHFEHMRFSSPPVANSNND